MTIHDINEARGKSIGEMLNRLNLSQLLVKD
jgi:hypothetical protein